jgi:hypothetical protein
MIEFVQSLPVWIIAMVAVGGFILTALLVIGVVYRMIRFGVKIKAGQIEIDATDDTEAVK